MWKRRIACGVLGVGLLAGGTLGDDNTLSIYGSQFIKIGDPGNRDTVAGEVPMYPDVHIGGVDHEFWLASTEVTVGQHFEFVQAYYPIYVKNTGHTLASSEFVGYDIIAAPDEIIIRPSADPGESTQMSWEYAARYINWLHNGKVNEEWAFETGVYDTSTFFQDDDGVWHHQAVRNPDARFFLPTWDEWTKAGYWDPQKNNGKGGYWRYQNSSDTEPVPGLPSEGAERNAGDSPPFPLVVGSYPNVKSPWGMLDMAGGQSELTESAITPDRLNTRIFGGTPYGYDYYGDFDSRDIIAYGNTGSATSLSVGLRLGAASGTHPADLNEDGWVNFFDVSLFIRWFIDHNERADFHLDGVFDADDVRVFWGFVAAQ